MFNNKEYVIAVQKYKSFSKAAKQLYISQPSLSASVKRIEAEVGFPLFDRSTYPLSLTEIGEKYVSCANEMLAIENNFKSFLNDSSDVLTGEIKIGGSSMFSSFVLPHLISEFNKKYPKIEFNIIEDNTQNLMNMLADGQIDIVVDNVFIQNKSVKSFPLMSEVLLLAVPESAEINKKLKDKVLTSADIRENRHKLSTAPAVPLAEFADEQFILLKSENDTGKRAIKLFKKNGITPNVIFKLDQQMTAYNITTSGVGLSFISDTLIAHTSAQGVCYYKIDDDDITRNIYFYVKNNRYVSNACQRFLDVSLGHK